MCNIHYLYAFYIGMSLFQEWNEKKTYGHHLERCSHRCNITLRYLTTTKLIGNLSASLSKVNVSSVLLSVIPSTTFYNTWNIILWKRIPYFFPIMIRRSCCPVPDFKILEFLKYLGSNTTNDARYAPWIKSRIALEKQHLFTNKLYLRLRVKPVKLHIWSIALHLRNSANRHTWKILKCGAGEGRRWSVGPIAWGMK
jgi:hypothetical protein